MCHQKEGNILFNDALSTFYLVIWHWTYGKGPFRQSKRKLFLINNKGFFYKHYPTKLIVHTMAFVTLDVEHWLQQEIA